MIQSRPIFRTNIKGIDLPTFDPVEYKKLAAGVELAIGSSAGAAMGALAGIGVMGINAVAFAPALLGGGIVFCAMGFNMEKRSAENIKMSRKIRDDVDRILVFYEELQSEAASYKKEIEDVYSLFVKQLKLVQRIVNSKTDWLKFSYREKSVIEQAVLLAGVLHKMCSVQLVRKARSLGEIESVNRVAIETAKTEGKIAMETVSKTHMRLPKMFG